MPQTAGFILLLCIATAVAIVSRRLRIPFTIALVLTGLALGTADVVMLPHLTKELLFSLFLPGLLFEASYHLHYRELRASAWTIGILAVPGVVVAVLITAYLLTGTSGMLPGVVPVPWKAALVFGAVIAATDPVAVVALFRQVAAPRQLEVLVESESLLNDGTSIVLLSLVLAYLGGTDTTAWSLSVDFGRIVLGGAAAGLVTGWTATRVIRRVDDVAIEITITTIAAYGSFAVAEHLHVSGVIATVVAGILCGNHGRVHAMSPATQQAVHGFWEWTAFVLNSAVFLLLGAAAPLAVLIREWALIVVAALAVLAARAAVVFGTGALLARTREGIPPRWSAVMTWGGLRGALSMVLALGLPEDLAQRAQIVTVTAGVVILSLVGQGLTMRPLLRRLRMSADAPAVAASVAPAD
ncbi:MAG: sodium:proton antiporter [Gemmatimonadaceae bacterium]|nr:sodium:proton antiporter [Gemmatimonadaceae bacterium]NUS47435.1 sodium:proton antiporter [Gemmatimonadaceae bacterium]